MTMPNAEFTNESQRKIFEKLLRTIRDIFLISMTIIDFGNCFTEDLVLLRDEISTNRELICSL